MVCTSSTEVQRAPGLIEAWRIADHVGMWLPP